MSEYQPVAKVGAVPEGEGRSFSVDGRMVAVFLIDGEYKAINDLCPHMGASLASGHVEGCTVTCPWHAWRFSVDDGTWLDNPKVKTDSWPVRVDGDQIQVQLPPRDPPPQPAGGEPAPASSTETSETAPTEND